MSDFADVGVVALPGAFDAGEATAMHGALWDYVEQRCSYRRHDPSTWQDTRLPPGVSLKGLKANPAFGPLGDTPALRQALDDIFGPSAWDPLKARGARILLTFPGPQPWVMPTGWHMDTGFDAPTFPVPWVQLWAFIDRVEPCGGGTLLLAGSHRLVERYRADLAPQHRSGNGDNWARFMCQHPFLDLLRRGGSDEEPLREMIGTWHEVAGTRVQVVELTGEPGDMFISHGQVFHCVAPNAGNRPRQMLTASVLRR